MSIRQRMYPTTEQVGGMTMHCNHVRAIYNAGLFEREMYGRVRRDPRVPRVNLATQMRGLSQARESIDWLREGSSSVQQAALRDLDRAFTNFFDGRAKYPKPKKKNVNEGSFVIRDVKIRFHSKKHAAILVPKVGWVRFRYTRKPSELLACTSARVTWHGRQWHVSLVCPPPPKKQAQTGAVVGIDRGTKNTIATSDGELTSIPTWTVGEQARYLALQHKLARQKKGSKRRRQTLNRIAVMWRRLTDRRNDWIEKATTHLAENYDLIVLERLNTSGMVKRPAPKPDPDNPGQYLRNGATAKSRLNRAIHSSCWYRFEKRLQDKTDGVVFVPAPYTSQQCRSCGHTDPESRESQAVFRCVRCGYEAHADTNAAENILARALMQSNPGTPGDRTRKTHPVGSVKEPIRTAA